MFSFMKVMFKFYAIRFEMLKCLGFFSCFVFLFCFVLLRLALQLSIPKISFKALAWHFRAP